MKVLKYFFSLLLFLLFIGTAQGEQKDTSISCMSDTLDYLWPKTETLGLQWMDVDEAISGLGELYTFNDSITIEGFYFYGFVFTDSAENKDVTLQVAANLYTPTSKGLPDTRLTTDTLTIDTTHHRHQIQLSSPVTVEDSFVLTVEALQDYIPSPTAARDSGLLILRSNSPDGNDEKMSIYRNGSHVWKNFYSSSAGTNDFDILLFPIVDYDISPSFSVTPREGCLTDSFYFNNQIAPHSTNKILNKYAWDTLPAYPIAQDTLFFHEPGGKTIPVDSLYWPFTNIQTTASSPYLLNFGDSTQTTTVTDTYYTYSSYDHYPISIKNYIKGWHNNTCGDQYKDTLEVGPLSTFTPDTIFCIEDSTIQLKATGGEQYRWSPALYLDDSTRSQPTFTPPDTGTYTYQVTVQDSNGCRRDSTITITVEANPLADFDYTIDSLTVHFSDASSFANSWNWDFDHGVPAFKKNPTHSYDEPGEYEVQLNIEGNCGSDVMTKTIQVSTNVSSPSSPDLQYQLHPNPADRRVRLQFTSPPASPVFITISTSTGTPLFNKKWEPRSSNTLNISTQDWAPGIYLLKIRTKKHFTTQKLQITH